MATVYKHGNKTNFHIGNKNNFHIDITLQCFTKQYPLKDGAVTI